MGHRISVLISTFNNRRYVEKKLAEIRRQTIFNQAEFLFVETASPERERELLSPFCAAHPNCHLLALDERKTLYEAWNLGWDAASSPVLCNSNMDDAMHPCLLEFVADAMERRSWDACSVLIARQMMDGDWNDWSPARLRQLPLSRRPGPFTAWRAGLKDVIGKFDGQFFSAGDLDFWSRIVAKKLSVGLIRKVLYLYTRSAEQISKSAAYQSRKENDRKLMNEKTYPRRWPPRIWREVFFLRYWLRLSPGTLCVPEPERPTGNEAQSSLQVL